MDLLSSLVHTMTPDQRVALRNLLLETTPLDPPPIATPSPQPTPPVQTAAPTAAPTRRDRLNLQDAIAITFKAALVPSDKARDPQWAQTYDRLWFKGHYQVKGPKGGVYCFGRAVLGNPQREQYKGMLKISNRNFLQLQAGGAIVGWFLPDDSPNGTNVLIGTLQQFQALP